MADEDDDTMNIEVTAAERDQIVDGLILLRKQYQAAYEAMPDPSSSAAMVIMARRMNDLAGFIARVQESALQG